MIYKRSAKKLFLIPYEKEKRILSRDPHARWPTGAEAVPGGKIPCALTVLLVLALLLNYN